MDLTGSEIKVSISYTQGWKGEGNACWNVLSVNEQ